jgi:ATP-dependent DNA helicase DinG
MADYLEEVFGEAGLFASRFPGYQPRAGQIALARAVDAGMHDGRHVIGEAPCGTGKGVAYSVPAVWHAVHRKRRVVIATANIALQEQLHQKDLPLLADVLPWKFSFALLKGRGNFLCRDAFTDAEARGELIDFDRDVRHELDEIVAWSKRTETGDVSELPFVPSQRVWSRVSVGPDDCKGDRCAFRDRCFAERARTIAENANLVVTNYHLLFAHLAIRRETGFDLVLPPFDFAVLDEAHEAAEVARDFFGFSCSEFSVRRLSRLATELDLDELAARLTREGARLFGALGDYARSPAYKSRLRSPGFVQAEALDGALRELGEALCRAASNPELDERLASKAERGAEHAERLRARIQESITLSDPDKVYFIELDGQGRARLCAKAIDVSELLKSELFGETESVALVSATLATQGSFEFVRRELGAPEDAIQLVVDSPFDFRRQALLVVPEGMPEPRSPEFPAAVADRVQEVIERCDGRTLALFTSYRNLGATYERIRRGKHRVLRQGEMPRTELARIFKEDTNSVLLGTESFWTGIDVPGEALTGLVIDKLPFPSPDDPVVDAISSRDPKAFANYLVPRAIIVLRQGVGRLIRSEKDVGVVVILDRRIAEKGYGKRFLRSLPPMMTSRKLESIGRFLEEANHAGAS